MRIVVATRSSDKLREIREIAGPLELELVSLSELGLDPTPAEDAIEIHKTFLENSTAKARYFAHLLGSVVLADDSGLEVAALNGRPGVRSKRFARDEGAHAGLVSADLPTDEANNLTLLRLLEQVPDPERAARYVCACVVMQPDGPVNAAIGTCDGLIGREPKGLSGFGYDPLFMLPDLGVSFGQLSAEQKHVRSHRAHALRALLPTLSELSTRG